MQCSFISIDLWRSKREHMISRRMLSKYHSFCVWCKQTHTTVHTARTLQNPPTPRFFMSADSHSLSRRWVDCLLIWAILKPRDAVAVVRGKKRRTATRWVTRNQNLNLFYLRTNNATKWQLNQTTVNTNIHFMVDAIMYMYVNNLKTG